MGSSCVCSVMIMVPTRSINQYSKFPATGLSIMKDVTISSSTEMLCGNFSASSPSKRNCLFDAKSYSRRRYRCRSQPIADFAPAASAAYGILLVTGGIFACIRFVATREVIPAGLLLVFSISSMAVSFSAYLQDKH